MKKITGILLAFALLVTSVVPTAAATPSAKTVKAAYVSFMKKGIQNGTYDKDLYYVLYDFNKDGVKELVISEPVGVRGIDSLYTYRKGKVVALEEGTTRIGYIPGKKYVVSFGSGGAADFDYTVYKIKSGKLEKVTKYSCESGVYKKDGRKISQSKFEKFENSVCSTYGKSSQIKTNHFGTKMLG